MDNNLNLNNDLNNLFSKTLEVALIRTSSMELPD